MEEIYKAIILGVIQGLTEYLPISSTAHLRIIPSFFGWKDIGAAYTAVIQIGTMAAIIIYFRNDLLRMLTSIAGTLKSKSNIRSDDSRLFFQIILGTIPIVIVGFLLKGYIRNEFRNMYLIAASILFFSVVLFISERWSGQIRTVEGLSFKDSFFIGIFQAFALIPGASRSGTTISGGFFRNMKREDAARFSFLLSIPAVTVSGIYELYSEKNVLFSYRGGALSLVIATLVSGIVGYLSIWFLLSYLKSHTLRLFIIYRVLFAIVIIVLLYFQLIKA